MNDPTRNERRRRNSGAGEYDTLLADANAVRDRIRDLAVLVTFDGLVSALREVLDALAPEDTVAQDFTRKALRLRLRQAKRKVHDAHQRTAEVAAERDAARAALIDAIEAFEECTGDYAKELAEADIARWRAAAGVVATGDNHE